jgi:hypothetical protein
MNKIVLGIGAIAVLATVLISSSAVGSSVVLAGKSGPSNAQSAAVNNECVPVTDVRHEGTAGFPQADILSETIANCIGSNIQNQDSDGAAIASIPSTSNGNDQSTDNDQSQQGEQDGIEVTD